MLKAPLTSWCPLFMETWWLAQGHTLKSLSHKQVTLTLAYPQAQPSYGHQCLQTQSPRTHGKSHVFCKSAFLML